MLFRSPAPIRRGENRDAQISAPVERVDLVDDHLAHRPIIGHIREDERRAVIARL